LQPVLCALETSSAVAESGMLWVDLDKAAEAGVPTPIRKLIRQVASARD
jgi:A/G-specific adenine glycosylase